MIKKTRIKFNTINRMVPRNRIVTHLLILGFFMLLTGIATVRLGQDVNFDLHNYHYNNPYSLLSGKLEGNIAVSGVQSYENPLRDVPAYLLMSNLSPKEAGFVLGALQGVNLWLVFELLYVSLGFLKISRLRKLVFSFLVATFTLYGSGFNSELGTTMGDNTTSVFVLLSLLLLVYSGKKQTVIFSPNTLRVLSFISIGVSAGLKLTNIAYLLGIFAAGYFLQPKPRFQLKKLSIDVLAISAGVFIAGGLWFIKIWLLFKNPIFPFYNGLFKSDYYPIENFVDTRWNNSTLWHSFFEPFSYINHQAISSEVYFRDPRLAVMFVVVVPIVLYFLYKRFISQQKSGNETILTKEYAAILIFAFVAYIAWCIQFSYYRYLIAIELISLPIIALSIAVLLKKYWLSVTVVTILCLGITLNTIQTSWGRVPWQTTNFGVSKADFSHLGDSTIIIAGYQPYSFLIPYMPDSTQVLRVTSDLSSPKEGTKSMQQLIKNQIEISKRRHEQYHVLVVDEDRVHANSALNGLEFKIGDCSELSIIVRQNSPNKYRLCELKYD